MENEKNKITKEKGYDIEKIKIPGYEIVEKIGGGSNSFVYKALKDDKEYAIKIIKHNITEKFKQEIKYQRYINEIKFQSIQNSPYIVKILDYGEFNYGKNKKLYYISPLYKCDLEHKLNEDWFSPEESIKYFINLCEALYYAHNYDDGVISHVIHRDIKPENIMFDEVNKKLLLTDFGIAHFENSNITVEGEKLANYQFVSPEQIKHDAKVGPYTDIFAMGMLLNYLFTKSIPLGRDAKTVSEVYPQYAEIDSIVKSMIVSDINLRESNILNVKRKLIHLYHLNNYKIKLIKESVVSKPFVNLKDTKVSKIVKMMYSDMIFADYLINQKYVPTNYNDFYHNNLGYVLKPEVYNTLFILECYEGINDKIDYELVHENRNEHWMASDKSTNLICYKELNDFFKNLDGYKIFRIYADKILRLLFSLEDYHAKEFVKRVKSDYDLSESNRSFTIVELVKHILELRNKGFFKECKPWDLVNIDLKKSQEEIIVPKLIKEDKYQIRKHLFEDKIKASYIYDSDDSSYVVISFENLEAKQNLIGLVKEAKQNKLKDNIDIDDIINDLEGNNLIVSMEKYNFEIIIGNQILNFNINN